MSFFLSKKERLIWEKQQLAAAVRRQTSVEKALKQAEIRQSLDRKKSAWEKYQELEGELSREMARQRRRTLLREKSEGRVSGPVLRLNYAGGKEDVSTDSPQSTFPYASSLDTATHKANQVISSASQSSPNQQNKLKLRAFRSKAKLGHLPPPSIPYPTSSGEVMSVHILSNSRPKSNLTPGNPCSVSPRKSLCLPRANSIPPQELCKTPGLLPQFHVFRDLSLDS